MKTERQQNHFETLHFSAKDGLSITADLYPVNGSKDLIVLCHRSHCNRGEYRETAPRLNERGFSCLAIDQRSGMKVFDVVNETSLLAKKQGLSTGYLDAKQDIEAAVDYAYHFHGNRPIILFGSSYSASLALLISAQTEKIKATIAFSPGECLKGVRVAEQIASLKQPLFVTGAKKEMPEVREIVHFVPPKNVTIFEPSVEGFHGSKTLWFSVPGHEIYWQALALFLSQIQS